MLPGKILFTEKDLLTVKAFFQIFLTFDTVLLNKHDHCKSQAYTYICKQYFPGTEIHKQPFNKIDKFISGKISSAKKVSNMDHRRTFAVTWQKKTYSDKINDSTAMCTDCTNFFNLGKKYGRRARCNHLGVTGQKNTFSRTAAEFINVQFRWEFEFSLSSCSLISSCYLHIFFSFSSPGFLHGVLFLCYPQKNHIPWDGLHKSQFEESLRLLTAGYSQSWFLLDLRFPNGVGLDPGFLPQFWEEAVNRSQGCGEKIIWLALGLKSLWKIQRLVCEFSLWPCSSLLLFNSGLAFVLHIHIYPNLLYAADICIYTALFYSGGHKEMSSTLADQ
jgi:hypothetical protein